jgi:hypothetical protein
MPSEGFPLAHAMQACGDTFHFAFGLDVALYGRGLMATVFRLRYGPEPAATSL